MNLIGLHQSTGRAVLLLGGSEESVFSAFLTSKGFSYTLAYACILPASKPAMADPVFLT